MKRRVIQFSTGDVGEHALRALIGRPDLELVGVHAHAADKIGRDAAELCGLTEPTGLVATHDLDALLALDADCIIYMSQAETRPREAIKELIKFLASGVNVVGTSLVWMVAPQYADRWLGEPLQQACKEGGSTLYINGIDPGFSGDTLVHAAGPDATAQSAFPAASCASLRSDLPVEPQTRQGRSRAEVRQ